MLQRLVLALVYTFGASHQGSQGLVLPTLCILFCVMHTTVRPMRCAESQSLQTTLLVCLSVRAVVGALQEGVLLAGGTDVPPVARPLVVAFGVVLPVAASVWAYQGYVVKRLVAEHWGKWRGRPLPVVSSPPGLGTRRG
jgi:hypothetical protein